jgi:hypothetical protein
VCGPASLAEAEDPYPVVLEERSMKLVKDLRLSTFGRLERVDHGIKGADLIVAFGNNGYGLHPLWVGLPNQLYERHILEWEKQGWREITVAPVGARVVVAK